PDWRPAGVEQALQSRRGLGVDYGAGGWIVTSRRQADLSKLRVLREIREWYFGREDGNGDRAEQYENDPADGAHGKLPGCEDTGKRHGPGMRWPHHAFPRVHDTGAFRVAQTPVACQTRKAPPSRYGR